MQNLFIRAQIAARQRVAQRMSRIYALRTKPSKLPIQRQTIQHCESSLVRRSSQQIDNGRQFGSDRGFVLKQDFDLSNNSVGGTVFLQKLRDDGSLCNNIHEANPSSTQKSSHDHRSNRRCPVDDHHWKPDSRQFQCHCARHSNCHTRGVVAQNFVSFSADDQNIPTTGLIPKLVLVFCHL